MNFHKILPFIQLMRWDKPIGFFLLLWPTLMALWLAGNGHPNSQIVCLFVAGVFIMRSVGCAINDLADRKFDGFVSRTQNRPIASGVISLRSAVLLIVVLLFFALWIDLQFNALTIQISILALLITLIYPLMKRYIHFPQVVLGAAFGMGVPMSFAAIQNHVPPASWILYCAVLCWTVAFDTEYAMKDREEDLKIGLKSTAILFGKWDRLAILFFQLMSLALLSWVGLAFKLNQFYYISLLGSFGFFIYQQYLIKDRNPNQCFKAFLNNHYLGVWWFASLLGG